MTLRLLLRSTILITCVTIIFAWGYKSAHAESCQERDVVITAYYSPLPNQTRYIMGSYDDDISFNGWGIAGADSTEVYPGMIAAPQQIPFGTRIAIPELDVTGTVHDRGGDIVMKDGNVVRLDVWMGHGEEGLARAMTFGVERTTAQFCLPGTGPEEHFALSQFPAPIESLAHLPENPVELIRTDSPRYGDTNAVTAAIQHALREFGYFDHAITAFFGDVTQEALRKFQRDSGIGGDGSIANEQTRTLLLAHRTLLEDVDAPEIPDEMLLYGSENHKAVRTAQRVLKLVTQYDEPADGQYDRNFKNAITQFQQDANIIPHAGISGAGTIGPQTRLALLTAWRNYRIAKRGGAVEVVAMQ